MQIRPFLFSWPTGTFHNYITAIKRGAEGDQTQVDFVGEPYVWVALTMHPVMHLSSGTDVVNGQGSSNSCVLRRGQPD